MTDSEFGTCQVCKKTGLLVRTYFRYDIACECHSPYHFEVILHHKECVPIEPTYTKVTHKTTNLRKAQPDSTQVMYFVPWKIKAKIRPHCKNEDGTYTIHVTVDGKTQSNKVPTEFVECDATSLEAGRKVFDESEVEFLN